LDSSGFVQSARQIARAASHRPLARYRSTPSSMAGSSGRLVLAIAAGRTFRTGVDGLGLWTHGTASRHLLGHGGVSSNVSAHGRVNHNSVYSTSLDDLTSVYEYDDRWTIISQLRRAFHDGDMSSFPRSSDDSDSLFIFDNVSCAIWDKAQEKVGYRCCSQEEVDARCCPQEEVDAWCRIGLASQGVRVLIKGGELGIGGVEQLSKGLVRLTRQGTDICIDAPRLCFKAAQQGFVTTRKFAPGSLGGPLKLAQKTCEVGESCLSWYGFLAKWGTDTIAKSFEFGIDCGLFPLKLGVKYGDKMCQLFLGNSSS